MARTVVRDEHIPVRVVEEAHKSRAPIGRVAEEPTFVRGRALSGGVDVADSKRDTRWVREKATPSASAGHKASVTFGVSQIRGDGSR